jgi:hypothetical protein
MPKIPIKVSSRSAPEDRAHVAVGELFAGVARLVVLEDRRRHRCRLARGERVLATHDSLQLGELAHHAGDEVGLGQRGGPLQHREL